MPDQLKELDDLHRIRTLRKNVADTTSDLYQRLTVEERDAILRACDRALGVGTDG